MFFHLKKSAIATCVLMSVAAAGVVYAAGLTKITVPKSICSDKKRTFYRSSLPEVTLARVTLGRSVNEVLAKWGDPTKVTVGSKEGETEAEQPSTYAPPAGNAPYGTAPRGTTGGQGNTGGGLPPLPGITPPGTTANEPAGESKSGLDEDEVCYTYKIKGKNPITLDFVINNGIVTQITASGAAAWQYSKTKTGLMLGDSYALTLWVCGTPEQQKNNGKYLQVSYAQKNRSVYTFLNKKLVGVTIALMPETD